MENLQQMFAEKEELKYFSEMERNTSFDVLTDFEREL